MKTDPQGVFFRLVGVPKPLAAELRQAAIDAGVPLKVGFAMLCESLIAEGDDGLYRAVLAGQLRAREFDGEKLEPLTFHLPVEIRAALVAEAKATGVQVQAIGRLLLIGRAGRVADTVLSLVKVAASEGEPATVTAT